MLQVVVFVSFLSINFSQKLELDKCDELGKKKSRSQDSDFFLNIGD